MRRILKAVGCILTLCFMLIFSNNSLAVDLKDWSVDINVMTIQQRDEMQSQAGDNVTTANAYLTKNNQNGTNGSICSPFVAEKNGMVFILVNAPGATNYNVQLYEGKAGQGKAVSNYATTDVNNGVYFTGLTIGKEYYIKISSSTLVTSGCTATYETIAFDS